MNSSENIRTDTAAKENVRTDTAAKEIVRTDIAAKEKVQHESKESLKPAEKPSKSPEICLKISDEDIKNTFVPRNSLISLQHPTKTSKLPTKDKEQEDPKNTSNHFLGLLYAVASAICYSSAALIIKVVEDVSPIQFGFVRAVGILLPTCILLIYQKRSPWPNTKRLMLLLRSIVGTLSLVLCITSERYLPIADASTIIFSAPVVVTIMARIFLKESFTLIHVLVVLLTMTGIILIARPPFLFGSNGTLFYDEEETVIGVASACFGVIFSASVFVLTRVVKELHPSIILFHFSATSALSSLILTLCLERPQLPGSWFHGALVILMGSLGFLGQFILTKALQVEEAGPVCIVRSSVAIIIAFVLQYAFLNVEPTVFSMCGATLVTISVVLISLRKLVEKAPVDSKLAKTCWCIKC